jgi:GntR family transcriptional regulator
MPSRKSSMLRSLPLDKKLSAPFYLQIADGLRKLLQSGAYPPGFLLPTERELCEHYGVSRMTLRQGIGVLEREGLVTLQRGAGTYVAPNRLTKQQQEFRSFTEEIRSRGGNPRARLVSFDLQVPSEEARQFFQLAIGQKVFQLVRVRLDSETPISLEHVEIPEVLCPTLRSYDFEQDSLYRVLVEDFGFHLESSIDEISARMPTQDEKKLLEMPPKVVILDIHRRTFTDSGQNLELARSAFRGDLYSAIVHSRRSKGERPNLL